MSCGHWLAALALALGSCANTTDVYVGTDLRAPRAGDGSGSAAGYAPAPADASAPPRDAGATSTPSPRDAAPEVDNADAGSASTPPDGGPMLDAAVDAHDAAVEPEPACDPGTANCDGDPSNGCEVDTNSSMAHCGGCDRRCHTEGHDALTAECSAGRCELTCRQDLFGDQDCDGDPDNGCETRTLTDDENCGQCGRACTCFNGTCL